MHLFIAREAMDPHLRRILPILNPKTGFAKKIKRMAGAFLHCAVWYPRQWMYLSRWRNYAKVSGEIRHHIRFIEKTSHALARNLFEAMAIHQQGLEKRQQLLFRFVTIGTDLFAMAATCSR